MSDVCAWASARGCIWLACVLGMCDSMSIVRVGMKGAERAPGSWACWGVDGWSSDATSSAAHVLRVRRIIIEGRGVLSTV